MRRGYAETASGQLHYATTGRGDPLVLLGAAWQSSRSLAPLAAQLAAGYRVIAVDPLGTGNSDPLPPGAGMDVIAGSIVQLLDSLAIERTHVWGLHTGNKIGAALGASSPERLRKLVLMGFSHSLIPDQRQRNEVILGRMGRYFDPETPPDPLRGWTRSFRRLSTLWWDDALTGSGGDAAAFDYVKNLALDEIQSMAGTWGVYRANFAYDLEGDLRSIAVPTLVLEVLSPGERHLGSQGEAVRALIPGAALRTLHHPDDSPFTFARRAEEIAAAIADFVG
jgi:pimeloyl-ACP methyl ester carboxylesterase